MVRPTEQCTVTREACTATAFLQVCSTQQQSQELCGKKCSQPSELVNRAHYMPILGITVYSSILETLEKLTC